VLAGRVIAQATSVPSDRVSKVNEQLIAQAWNGDAKALIPLMESNSDTAVDRFASRLKDKDAAVRARAAQILGQLRLERGTDSLLPLLRDPDAGVRAQVLGALGQSPSDRVIDPLLIVLRGDSRAGRVDSAMRVGAIQALGQVGSDRVVPALLVDLQTGEPEVRAAAAAALKKISAPLMVKPLASLAQSGDDESRRYATEILAVANNNILAGLQAPPAARPKL
jgi:HEAT repeat protein